MLRKVIKIDEGLCNGCGECVPSCAEGAIQIVDGKAKLVADKYCDGLGACLGECPTGALTFEVREADAFDEGAVETHLEEIGRPPEACVGKHHAGQPTPPAQGMGGCPGSRMFDFREESEQPLASEGTRQRCELRHWPVKLNLLNPAAPYLHEADLVLAADCAAFAYASFHPEFLKGHVLAIGCPKFDDVQYFADKLAAIIEQAEIKSITVAHMEVPCCSGLVWAARKAVEKAGREVPLKDVTISIRGELGAVI